MTNIHDREKGFSAVEAVLILFIISMIGFVSWYVWHVKQAADKTLTKSAASTRATPKQASDPKQVITHFYQDYITHKNSTQLAKQLDRVVKKYGTSHLMTSFNSDSHPPVGYSYNEDPIVCTATLLEGFQVSDIRATSTGASADVLIKTKSPVVPVTAKVMLVGGLSAGYQIDSVTCDPPAVLGPAAQN